MDKEQINEALKRKASMNNTGIEIGTESEPVDTVKKSFKELTGKKIGEEIKDVSQGTKLASKSESLKTLVDLAKTLPGVKKLLPVAKAAGKYAGPVGVALAIGDGLADVRWDELSNDDKSRATRIANLVNDVTGKTIINTVGSTAEGLPTALAWAGGQALDTFNELFGDKEARETDYSSKAVKAWDDSKIKNWLQNTRAKMLGFQDKMIYGKDNTNEYKNELGLDDKGNKLPEPIETEAESMGFGKNEESNMNKLQIENKPKVNDLKATQEQGRRIVQFKDGTYGYASQGGDTKGKLVTGIDESGNRVVGTSGGFKTLDEAKQAIDSGVKGYHLGEIKKGISNSPTTEGVKQFLQGYANKVDLKSKGITPDDILHL